MSHTNTVFQQVIKFVPRHEFSKLENKHKTGRSLRANNQWDQFIAMSMTKLSDDLSLRDIENNMRAQEKSLYHLGGKPITRSTLARINEKRSYELYEELFYTLQARCHSPSACHRFRFKNPLYSMDSTQIALCLDLLSEVNTDRNHNPAVKVHMALNHAGEIPHFVRVTDVRVSDINGVKEWKFEPGSIVAFDRGYFSHKHFKQLNDKGILFVTRQRTDLVYRVVDARAAPKNSHVLSDETIEFTSKHARHSYHPPNLRKVQYRDPETEKVYAFLTNIFHLSAQTIADIYKDRWRIETFFKYLKQNLKIKRFVGKNLNAILTQIWITMIVHLMLTFLKWATKTSHTLLKMIRLIKLNLFSKKAINELLGDYVPDKLDPPQMVLSL